MAGLSVSKIERTMTLVILLNLFILNGKGAKLSLGTVIIDRREFLVVGQS